MAALLRVQDLTVSYTSSRRGPRVLALNNLSFEIKSGQTMGILGESGCGKTTLALTLMGLLPSSARVLRGSVVFDGINLLKLSEAELQKVRGARTSMVHQEPGMALNPVLRVGEQIGEVIRAHKCLSRNGSREDAKSLLIQVGLGDCVWNAYPHQLSGGQQQRVAIAQAIACEPSLLIADEPTTALDSATQIEILNLLRRLQQKLNLAVVLISHDPAVLASFGGSLLVMYAGRVVEEGPAEQVLSKSLHPYTQGLLRCRPPAMASECKQPWPTIAGDPPDLAHLPLGCCFEPRCPERMEICKLRAPESFQPASDRQVACFKYAS